MEQVLQQGRITHIRFGNMAQAFEHYMPLIGGSRGLIYVGANTGQEIALCKRYADHVYAFEPVPEPSVWDQLIQHEDHKCTCLNYALSDQAGTRKMWPSSNNFESSSLLAPDIVLSEYAWIEFGTPFDVEVKRLDQFPFVTLCDVIVMDVQGAELQVLNGISVWFSIKMIILEYNSADLYANSCIFDQLQHKLETEGFEYWESFDAYHNTHTGVYAGNAVFIKKGIIDGK